MLSSYRVKGINQMKSIYSKSVDERVSLLVNQPDCQFRGSVVTFMPLALLTITLLSVVILTMNDAFAQRVNGDSEQPLYKSTTENDSEFDNPGDGFVVNWRNADAEYEDTVFGELIYNEPSTPTKLEMLRLLSKETPSTIIFMHAISMGLGIDEMLQAAVQYSPEKARELAGSAVSVLPLVGESEVYRYSSYDIDGLTEYVDGLPEEKKELYSLPKNQPYSAQAVIDRFFEQRLVLKPFPDWFDGQVHFMASARQLSELQSVHESSRWYRSKSSKPVDQRPIFISLYEYDETVLIDGRERINAAFNESPEALLPVVFIYNRVNERPIDALGYPETLTGIRDAYIEKNLMITPTPEWQIGEYHVFAELSEFYELFDIPEESDFEPEVWEKLLREAENYDVNETSFVAVVLGGAILNNGGKKDNVKSARYESANESLINGSLLAAWDDPRSEGQFKYTSPNNTGIASLNEILGKGLIFNRPDLVAALNALGVSGIPVSIYYLDSARVKPFRRGPRSLIQSAIGVSTPSIVPPGGRATTLPPASPPGLP